MNLDNLCLLHKQLDIDKMHNKVIKSIYKKSLEFLKSYSSNFLRYILLESRQIAYLDLKIPILDRNKFYAIYVGSSTTLACINLPN